MIIEIYHKEAMNIIKICDLPIQKGCQSGKKQDRAYLVELDKMWKIEPSYYDQQSGSFLY